MRLSTSGGRFVYGPVLRRFRERSMRKLERSGRLKAVCANPLLVYAQREFRVH